MLEIKNGRLERGGKTLFSNLSFVARGGEAVCVSSPMRSGKTSLLRSFLGFLYLDDGFVSVEGELIDAFSSRFFRKQMSYLPQVVNFPYQKVSDMMEQLLVLKEGVSLEESKASLMVLWKELGIHEESYGQELSEITIHQRRLLMVTGLCVLQHPIVLMDEPTTGMVINEIENIGLCIRHLIKQGVSVVVTCQEHDPIVRYCDKLIELNTHSYS